MPAALALVPADLRQTTADQQAASHAQGHHPKDHAVAVLQSQANEQDRDAVADGAAHADLAIVPAAALEAFERVVVLQRDDRVDERRKQRDGQQKEPEIRVQVKQQAGHRHTTVQQHQHPVFAASPVTEDAPAQLGRQQHCCGNRNGHADLCIAEPHRGQVQVQVGVVNGLPRVKQYIQQKQPAGKHILIGSCPVHTVPPLGVPASGTGAMCMSRMIYILKFIK